MTNIIKLKFIKGGQAVGRDYTYYTPEPVEVGDTVDVMTDRGVTTGRVTYTDVPESEIAPFKDRAKAIIGKTQYACERCEHYLPIGEGDHLCDLTEAKIVTSEYMPTADYGWCGSKHYKEARE